MLLLHVLISPSKSMLIHYTVGRTDPKKKKDQEISFYQPSPPPSTPGALHMIQGFCWHRIRKKAPVSTTWSNPLKTSTKAKIRKKLYCSSGQTSLIRSFPTWELTFLLWISEIFLTWIVKADSEAVISSPGCGFQEAYAWRMLSSFGWKPVLGGRQGHTGLRVWRRKMRCMPPHGPDYTPNPHRCRCMASLVEMRWSITHHHPAKPQKCMTYSECNT